MPTYHRSQRLRLVGTGPKVEQLQEGRFRLTFTCTATNPNEAWMNGNKDQIMTDYGTLQSAQKNIAGIDPRTDEAYSDMVLFRTEANPSERDLLITLAYETATTSFVKSQDDKIDFELNGLQRVTRVTIAKTGTSLPSVTIGTTSITVNSTACKLASRSVEENDAFIQITEVYLQEGTVSESIDNVGSQEAKVVTTFGSDPSTPSGYSLAKKDESNFEGYQTNTFTFLRRDSLMLSSEDFIDSQNTIIEEWFDPTDQYIDAYVIEGSDPTAVDDETGINGTYYLLDTTANGKVRYSRSTPATNEFTISWSGSQWQIELLSAIVATSGLSTTHPPADPTSWTVASGYAIKTITRENVSPMPIESSELSNFDGSILFDAHIRKTKSGYSLASERVSNVGGIPTERYTFLKPSIISVTQDFIEDINTIQVTAFNKTASEVTSDLSEVSSNHKLISQREQNHDGITTNTYTFEINTSDVVQYTANNRLRVTRTIYESATYDYNANYNVGTDTITFESTTLILSALRVNKRGSPDTFVKLELVFEEPGESSRVESTGPASMPGTEKVTITSSGSTPVTLTETADIKLINKQEQNNNGFSSFQRSYIKGTDATSTTNSYTSGRTYKVASNNDYSSVGGPNPGVIGDYFEATSTASLGAGVTAYLVGQIIGTKVTYDNVISVQVPGTVKCVTNDAIGDLASNVTNSNKSQATLEVIPPNSIKITATVTESIQTSIPSISSLAYNLDDIACSVLRVNTVYRETAGPMATTLSGNLSNTGTQKSASLSTSNSYYPGSYVLDNDNTAIVATSTVKGRQYRIVSAGNTDFTSIGAANSTAGTVFIATGAGTGTGTVRDFGSEGKLTYQSSSTPVAGDTTIGFNTGDSETITSLITKGTTSQSDGSAPSSYSTTGTIQQKARPVLTTIDGTTYYEVVVFSKS